MQLHKTIKTYSNDLRIDYFFISPKKLQNFRSFKVKPKAYDFVLSTVRQRILFNHIQFLRRLIGDLPLRIYDQDPWENYIDYSQSNGCYSIISSQFDLREIFVTSNFWKSYIEKNDQIRSTFVKMGMLPDLCNVGLAIRDRRLKVEFRGTLHPHREKFFRELQASGLEFKINTEIFSYAGYLRYLRSLGIFVHDESGFWVCQGKQIPMSTGMWIKDIEIASQGCFSVRNYYPECESYSVDNIPLIQFYREPAEAKELITRITQLPTHELSEIQRKSVDFIKGTNSWASTVRVMLDL